MAGVPTSAALVVAGQPRWQPYPSVVQIGAEVIVVGLLGGAILTGSVLGALGEHISPSEQRAFRVVNGLPDWLYYLLWAPMQLGNLVVGTAAGLAVTWWLGDPGLAVAVVAAMALKLVSEKWLRRRMKEHLRVRQRPGTSEPGAILRGADVPTSGVSFPSGHVILVAAVGAVVWTGLPVGLMWVPWLSALLVALGRVYVGAHNPLDVTAGLGLGMAVGALLGLVVT
jgi:membrane-associated phospholipid phosphatase